MEFLGSGDTQLFDLIVEEDWLTTDGSPDPSLTFNQLPSQVFDIPIPQENISQLSDLERIVIRANLTTSEVFEDNFVWLFEHHGIDVQLRTVVE